MIKYSIVIATCRDLAMLTRCIDSVVQNTDLSNVEIIISANGCDEKVHDYLKSLQSPFKIIWTPERIGAASSKNLGFQMASGQYIVILDDDATIYPPHNQWLNVLEQPFLQDPQVGITGKILTCDYGKIPFVVGFCSMIKKEVFEQVGYYDTTFDPYFGEEQDFCYRASIVGFKIAEVDQQHWPIHHVCECEVTQENIPQHKSEGYCRNIHIIAKRYNSIKQEDLMPYVMSEPEYKNLPEGEFSVHDVAVYRYIVDHLPDDASVVEIGCGQGKSLCSIAWYIRTKGMKSTVVDNFKSRNGTIVPDPQKIKNALSQNVARYEISPLVTPRDSDSVSAASEFPDNHFDLIFIDADHSEEAVRNDINAWLPKLKDTGYMIGHDAAWVFPATSKMFPEELMMCGNMWLVKKEDILSKTQKKPKIYDCFPFFNELDLLEIRLNELSSVVDKFVIVEATKTHSGIYKPLYFEDNKDRFGKFKDKIIHIIVEDLPGDLSDYGVVWQRERQQRDACMQGLVDCQDDDIIIISDIDEIPKASAISNLTSEGVVALDLREYTYFLNYQKSTDNYYPWVKIASYKKLKELTPCGLRYYGWDENSKKLVNFIPDLVCIPNAGWHFSFIGDADQVKKKIESWAHQEYNRTDIKDNLEDKIKDKVGVYGSQYSVVSIDNAYPEYLINNLDKFQHMVFKENNIPVSNKKEIKYSIIIPTYNHLNDLLIPCIESIIKYTDLENVEIIIVANGCKDNTIEYVQNLRNTHGDAIQLLVSEEPTGYTRATNEGIKVARGNYIVLLNNDTALLNQQKNEWLNHLVYPFEKYSDTGVTGPNVLISPEINRKFAVFFCAMIKKEIIAKIGLLDEIFTPGGGEDIDFCVKAENAGYKIVQVPMGKDARLDSKHGSVGGFPIYHKAEATVNEISNWNGIFKDNMNKLVARYSSQLRDYRDITLRPEWLENRDSTIGMYNLVPSDVANKTIVDIGANKGFFTMISLEYGASKIYAVEPNSVNFGVLNNNVGKDQRVELLNYAAYDNSKSYVSLKDTDEQCRVSDIDNPTDRVSTITLSTILDKIPPNDDLVLKVDCEGSEFPFLFGAKPEDIKRFKTIFIEIHGFPITNEDPSKLSDYLVSLGYDIQWRAFVTVDELGNKTEAQPKLPIYKMVRKDANSPVGELKQSPMVVKSEYAPVHVVKPDVPSRTIDNKDTHASVTVVISTKDRYFTTLPHAIISIANQTVLPQAIRIYDDGEQINLTQNPLYVNIFGLLEQKGVKWYVHFGEKKGQVLNHQKSVIESETTWILRMDDDNILEPDVLEKLLSVATDKVGAVGGLVLDPKFKNEDMPSAASNKIEDIFAGLNIQWFKHKGISNVDHLYSSFLYRREASKHGYCLGLSPVGHREETIFTYEMKRNGWEILVNPEATTWHFRNSEGGIRSYDNQQLWQHDEEVFAQKINMWSVVPNNKKVIILNNGLGDHLAFRHIVPELKAKYGDDLIVSCCFPGVFADDGLKLISIQDGILYLNHNLAPCDVYKFMWDNNWKTSMVDAFRRMYI